MQIITPTDGIAGIDRGRGAPIVFLAGYCGNDEDWRPAVVARCKDLRGCLIDPRLDPWPEDAAALKTQTAWESYGLRTASLVAFWFSKHSLQPISLFELGWAIGQDRDVCLGVDPDYPKAADLLSRFPQVSTSVGALADVVAGCVIHTAAPQVH